MQVSNHAQQRYAERIMDRDNKTDVAVYVAANRDKIDNDINKMIEYGEKVYSGKLEKGAGVTDVYLKDTWVILVDPNSKKVITLYKIDLGVGNEFNQQYVDMLLEKLKEEQKISELKKLECDGVINELKEQIQENVKTVNEYRTIANQLVQANANMEAVISDYEEQKYIAESNVREIVSVLIGKKIK